jgi:hypothetical protein
LHTGTTPHRAVFAFSRQDPSLAGPWKYSQVSTVGASCAWKAMHSLAILYMNLTVRDSSMMVFQTSTARGCRESSALGAATGEGSWHPPSNGNDTSPSVCVPKALYAITKSPSDCSCRKSWPLRLFNAVDAGRCEQPCACGTVDEAAEYEERIVTLSERVDIWPAMLRGGRCWDV